MENYRNDDYLLKHNLLEITSPEELEKAEVLAFSLRATKLEQAGVHSISMTMKGFQDLHYYLFQDVYSFAGTFRDVQLMKGNTRFCQAQFLDSYAMDLFRELNEEPAWEGLDQAAARLAYFKSELNMLHPFREGNGRTVRMYLYAYAFSRNVEWAYETINREKYMQAVIQSVTDLEGLRQLFKETIRFID